MKRKQEQVKRHTSTQIIKIKLQKFKNKDKKLKKQKIFSHIEL